MKYENIKILLLLMSSNINYLILLISLFLQLFQQICDSYTNKNNIYKLQDSHIIH